MNAHDKPASRPKWLGTTQISRNVAFAWGGFIAQAATGFVMPRLIADALGQSTLGVWDLAWSLITYLGFVGLGLSGSVNRFVAHHVARNDAVALTRSVSTVDLFLKVAGFLAATGAVAVAMWGLPVFANHLGAELDTARLAVLFLGLEVAISVSMATNLGVIVGCLRSDLHYTVSTLVYTLTLVAMVTVVRFGGGLTAIALVHFLVAAAGEVARWRLARAVCPQLKIDYSSASWRVWREQAKFTAKTTLPTIADILANQTASVLIALYLGPAALAVFSRPRNLVRQMRMLIARVGYILAPVASTLQARARDVELAATVREKSFEVALVTIPATATLAVLGDDVIRLWMGPDYVYPWLMAIVSLGTLPSLIQEPAWSVLSGMNRHGPLAVVRLAGSVCAVLSISLALSTFGSDLRTVAFALMLPIAIVDGMVVPALVCRSFSFSLRQYYQDTWLRPALYATPYVATLLLCRWYFEGGTLAAVLALSVSAPLLAIAYWVAFSRPLVPQASLCGGALGYPLDSVITQSNPKSRTCGVTRLSS